MRNLTRLFSRTKSPPLLVSDCNRDSNSNLQHLQKITKNILFSVQHATRDIGSKKHVRGHTSSAKAVSQSSINSQGPRALEEISRMIK